MTPDAKSIDDYLSRPDAERRLDALLLEGLLSGKAEPMTVEDWEDIREQVFGESDTHDRTDR